MSQIKVDSIIPRNGVPSGSQGGIIQYKYATNGSVRSTSSDSFVSSGLSITITPQSSDNKIIVRAYGVGHNNNQNSAGGAITTGSDNTCLGENAGDTIQSGSSNIALGKESDVPHDTSNAIVVGVGITATTNNEFSFGKASNVVSNIFTSNASFSRSSDLHKKTNIADTDIGLSFINELKPVTFNWRPNNEFPKHYKDYSETENSMDTEVNLYGMIAQDVEKALQKVGNENFCGWSKEEDGQQRLSQEMFIYPLINAVKELSAKVDELENKLN